MNMEEFISKHDITLSIMGNPLLAWEKQDEWKRNSNGYRVKLRGFGHTFSLDFWMGLGCKNPPTVEDVLESLHSDLFSPDTFEEFCDNYGYDSDSKKDERLFRAVQRQNKKVMAFLGDSLEEFEALDL